MCFRSVSDVFPKCFRSVSDAFPMSFRCVSEVFPQRFRCVSAVLPDGVHRTRFRCVCDVFPKRFRSHLFYACIVSAVFPRCWPRCSCNPCLVDFASSHTLVAMHQCLSHNCITLQSLRGSPVNIGTTQGRLTWPLFGRARFCCIAANTASTA